MDYREYRDYIEIYYINIIPSWGWAHMGPSPIRYIYVIIIIFYIIPMFPIIPIIPISQKPLNNLKVLIT